jgi:peptidoglycan/xylan/chitin deacetylase (PgdA/CDA1 family)
MISNRWRTSLAGRARLGRMVALVASCLLLAGVSVAVKPAPARAATQTIVTIEFDDGRADQAANAGPILAAHNVAGTFFINSGLIGTDSFYMTWDQVAGLAAAGNEIAGHTLTHVNIANLSYADARYQVCQDRVNLFNHGYQATSFAYPDGGVSDTAKRVVRECGYNSGRTTGGISKVCKCAESIPPVDAYATRAEPILGGTRAATLEQVVMNAEANGGGWVQIFMHSVGDGKNAFPTSELSSFLDWLVPRASRGTLTRTVSQVIGGTTQPPVLP